jgi:hypothetical protein
LALIRPDALRTRKGTLTWKTWLLYSTFKKCNDLTFWTIIITWEAWMA